MYGLDIFSGIGGLTKALEDYVQPVAYCENDRYAQSVLLSRMATGDLPIAPIWNDVQTLKASDIGSPVEIIYGGFPCQDISNAGRREGLGGSRSGLFFQIIRLAGEIRPQFIFLENVAAIISLGLGTVTEELTRLRYDCRWGVLSASDVGANHRRDRWWLLAHTMFSSRSPEPWIKQKDRPTIIDPSGKRKVANAQGDEGRISNGNCKKDDAADPLFQQAKWHDSGRFFTEPARSRQEMADAKSKRFLSRRARCSKQKAHAKFVERSNFPNTERKRLEKPWNERIQERATSSTTDSGWWSVEPDVGRVANGISFRVDRLRGLGNSVVPAQAKEAFERLMGLKWPPETLGGVND